jgi:hypothetical protein
MTSSSTNCSSVSSASATVTCRQQQHQGTNVILNPQVTRRSITHIAYSNDLGSKLWLPCEGEQDGECSRQQQLAMLNLSWPCLTAQHGHKTGKKLLLLQQDIC